MPYKNPERKRQWEREHREQRNAERKTQRHNGRSGQPSAPKPVIDIVAALRSHRKPPSNPVSNEPKSSWKATLCLVVGIGVVLLAVFTGARDFDTGATGS